MAFKECVGCAERIQAKAKICRFCGVMQDDTRFTSEIAGSEKNHAPEVSSIFRVPQASEEPGIASQSKQSKPKSKSGLLLATCVAVLVIFVISVVSYRSDVSSQVSSLGDVSAQVGTVGSAQTPAPAPKPAGLVLSLDKSMKISSPCSDSFCDFFSVQLRNYSNKPVQLFDDICLVANGVTYSENFGATVDQQVNPSTVYEFDATFRPASGARVTEMYIGDCIHGIKDASVHLHLRS